MNTRLPTAGSLALRFAVVVAAWLGWAATGSASCGDYLHIAGASDSASASPGDPPPKPPCHCENGRCDLPPPAAPAPTPRIVTPSAPADALLSPAPNATTVSRGFPLPSVDSTALRSCPADIFHPPRG